MARASAGPPAAGAGLALFVVAALAAAAATDRLGIHALFGAFLCGAIVPSDSRLAHAYVERIEPCVRVVLLPAFFALTGMRTRIDLLDDARAWALCALIIAVATVGKVGSVCLAARARGFGGRDAATLGALMNTRGLIELVVLGIGLDLGIISQPLFTMMVLMALATTIATVPLVRWLAPPGAQAAT